MSQTPSHTAALALVAVGAVAGALARHLVSLALPAAFPWGTLAVNVVGASLLAVLLAGTGTDSRLELLAGAGFCSSFTTYSAFAVETQALGPALALLNVTANYGLGFGAVVLGRAVARWRS